MNGLRAWGRTQVISFYFELFHSLHSPSFVRTCEVENTVLNGRGDSKTCRRCVYSTCKHGLIGRVWEIDRRTTRRTSVWWEQAGWQGKEPSKFKLHGVPGVPAAEGGTAWWTLLISATCSHHRDWHLII